VVAEVVEVEGEVVVNVVLEVAVNVVVKVVVEVVGDVKVVADMVVEVIVEVVDEMVEVVVDVVVELVVEEPKKSKSGYSNAYCLNYKELRNVIKAHKESLKFFLNANASCLYCMFCMHMQQIIPQFEIHFFPESTFNVYFHL
jgi:hypothetical protein